MLGALYSLHNTHIIVCFPYPPIHRKSSCSLLVFYTIDSAITRSLTGSFWVYRCSCFGFVHSRSGAAHMKHEQMLSHSLIFSLFLLWSLYLWFICDSESAKRSIFFHLILFFGSCFGLPKLRSALLCIQTYVDFRSVHYVTVVVVVVFFSQKTFFFVYFHMAGEIECSPFSILMRKTESGYLHLICCCYTASSVQIFFVSCKSEWCVPYEWMVHVLLNITRTQLQATEKRSILLW